MEPLSQALQVFTILIAVLGGIALVFLPGTAIARWILTPIDRAAKNRKAAVRFSIGDFLCLFVAVQLPLTAVYQLTGEDTRPQYWIFTVMTWIIAPVIWVACGRALSKAGVTCTWHRFVFLGLIMPLVYYGLVPFTIIGISFIFLLFEENQFPVRTLVSVWFLLVMLFFVSGWFVRWMLSKADNGQAPIAELEHQNGLALATMYDSSIPRLEARTAETGHSKL